MCLPYPAPRCSHHASQEYQLALRRFHAATTLEQKTRTGAELARKKEAYYLTPRGLNDLREQATETTDETLRAETLALISRYEKARADALTLYKHTLDKKDTELVDLLHETGKTLTKNGKATTLTALHLQETHPQLPLTVTDENTINIPNYGNILCLPPKHQHKWAEATLHNLWETEDEELQHLLRTINNPETPTASEEQNINNWFQKKLRRAGYIAYATVNLRTQDLELRPLHTLEETHDISLVLRKRHGGTTSWHSTETQLRELLRNTPYEQGEIIHSTTHKKTLITGVPLQAEKDRTVGNLYLAWKGNNVWEARRRHETSNWNILVRTSTTDLPLLTQTHPETKQLLNPTVTADNLYSRTTQKDSPL